MPSKRRRQGTEFYYDDVLLRSSDAPPPSVPCIQRHTEVSSRNMSVSTSQKYYTITAPLPQPPATIEEVQWNMESAKEDEGPGGKDVDEPTLDEPIDFINPPTVINELEATDGNRRRNRSTAGV